MIPRKLLETAPLPEGRGELRLYQRGAEFAIELAGSGELMNSHSHGTEDALAGIACRRLSACTEPHVLIGGLGMGFTLASALRHLGEDARVVVAELVPAVVHWNRGVLGDCSGRPLEDPRVRVHEGDVARMVRAETRTFDAILLDVDNGPAGFTSKDNDWLYSPSGLHEAYVALRPGGILAVWSAGPDERFERRLQKARFSVEAHRVRGHGNKGSRHVIWVATR